MRVSTKTRISQSITRSPRDIFLRKDLAQFGTPSRVTRAISNLIKDGKIVRLGYGVYAKTVPSVVTGNPVPRKVLETLTAEVFDSLRIPIDLGTARSNYAAGKTTQVPMSVIISTGPRRVNRKLKLGNREVTYEKNLSRAS
jgi:hypothetical protein